MEIMTISEVSKNFNVTTRMIRYYEKIGLIESSRKADYAYRVYDEEAIKHLQEIIILRKLRIPLKEIGIILNDKEQVQTLQIMSQNIAGLDEEIGALSTIRNILHKFVERLNQSIKSKIHLDLLEDDELIEIASALGLSKLNLKEHYGMEELNKANEMIHRLSDREVRIIPISPMAVAAIHCVSESPEADCHKLMRQFIKTHNLCVKKTDFRVFGFNHETPDCHGYELWVTIPEEMEVSEPFVKKPFQGGLYGAHMIPMGAFEEWKWLYEWAAASEKYLIDWRAPEHMCGGTLEEHLNYINIYDHSPEELDQIMQLDLLIPIKVK